MKALTLLAVGITLSLALAPAARAQDINWIDPLGGGFQDPFNWSTQTVPGPANSAVFNLANPEYSVLFSANATNAGLRVLDDVVTLDLNGFLYTVNTTFSLTDAAVQTARLTIKNGTLQANGATGVVIGSRFSDAALILNGSTTQLLATNAIHVGGDTAASATGALTVESGAVAQPTGGLFVGRFDGNLGTAIVTGLNSKIEVAGGAMSVGLGGTSLLTVTASGVAEGWDPDTYDVGPFGTVNVTAGGVLRTGGTVTPGGLSTVGAVGTAAGGTATVNVTGIGSRWELTGPASIGELCPALVTLNTGGVVDSRDPDVYNVGPFGTVNVNAGSTLRTGGSLTPGGTTTIGSIQGLGTATATVNGAGALWETFGPTNIGTGGPGLLTISAGGVVESTNPDVFNVGPFGTVNVNAGGALSTGGTAASPGGTTTIGAAGVGTATVNVDGAAALWDAWGQVNIGTAGDAAVSITGGGSLVQEWNPVPLIVGPDGLVTVATGGSLTTNGPASVGMGAGGTATVNVTDAASQWIGTGSMAIGTAGPGQLTISAGGLVDSRDPTPFDVGPFGTVNVNAGSILRTGGSIMPGGTTTIGTAAGGTAILFVGGAGARWEASGPVSIGQSGPASVAFSGGGVVESQDPNPFNVGPLGFVSVVGGAILRTGGSITPGGTTTLGTAPGGTGQLFVTGAGSRWELFGPSNVGTGGPGQLTVDSGGVVSAIDPEVWDVGPFGTVNVNAGGTLLTVGPVQVGTAVGGTARINVDGGFWLSGDVTIGLAGAAALAATAPDTAADEPIRALSASAGFFKREERAGAPSLPGVGDGSLGGTADSSQDRVGPPPRIAFGDNGMGHPNAAAPAQAAPDSSLAAMVVGPFVGEVMANGASGTLLQLSGLTITDGGSYRGTAGSAAAMTAKSAEVRGGGNGGQMCLSGNMSATLATSMRLDGTAFPCGPLRGCTPPILRMVENSSLHAASMDVLAGQVALSGGSITIIGPGTIDNGGAVVADSVNPLDSFSALSIDVNSTGVGGRLAFGGAMSVNVADCLSIVGCGAALRGCTPPILRMTGTPVINIGFDLLIGLGVEVNVAAGPTINLTGSFVNFATAPAIFDWSAGSLTMNGGDFPFFELAGENRGVNAAGFVDNFAMGTVRVEPGVSVDFVDLFDNVPGPGGEVLYVDTLSLGAGSTIVLNQCFIYYQNLVIDPGGATIDTSGGGAAVCLTPGDLNCDGFIDLNDAAAMVAALIDPAADPQATAAANLNGDGTTDGDDVQTMVNLLLGL